jgi:hypothetical protein
VIGSAALSAIEYLGNFSQFSEKSRSDAEAMVLQLLKMSVQIVLEII